MRIRLTGAIVDSEPRLPSRIAGKRLVLDGRGRDRMILDSGFTGSIAISEQWANRLDLRYAGIQPLQIDTVSSIIGDRGYGWIEPQPAMTKRLARPADLKIAKKLTLHPFHSPTLHQTRVSTSWQKQSKRKFIN
jgi:hypothetical protein